MSRIAEWFRERLLGPRAPVGRLDPARALEIARAAAAAADPWAPQLLWTDLQTHGSAKIWVVSTPWVGCRLIVEIDDATEAVLSIRRFGLR
jgi:hypothetical protein